MPAFSSSPPDSSSAARPSTCRRHRTTATRAATATSMAQIKSTERNAGDGVEAGGGVAGEGPPFAPGPRRVDAVSPRPVAAAGGIGGGSPRETYDAARDAMDSRLYGTARDGDEALRLEAV